MFEVNIDSTMVLAILPEILLLVLGALVLTIDLILPEERRSNLGWITAAGLGFVLLIGLAVARPLGDPRLLWGGMIRHDWLGFIFRMLFLFGAAITSLFATDFGKMGRRGEFYLLLIASTLGMMFMASAADLILLYLAIETTSVPLYLLAGFLTREDRSTEAGFKYLLFGALTSTIMLYGFSLLYGFAGTTSIYDLATGVAAGNLSTATIVGSLMFVLVGFGFKISAVPLHFWAPDVYEGAPTPVTGFLSTASKAAGFAVLIRVLLVAFPAVDMQWGAVAAALAVATMTLGNLLALAQRNIKRMLAYSSIAHAGYALIGVAAVVIGTADRGTGPIEYSALAVASVVFYLIAYMVTNLAAFGAVAAFSRITGSDEIASFAGLSRRAPGLALVLLVAFLSLAGMPPLGGFVVKIFVFAAAVDSNLIWLAVIGVLNSIIGLYYYLTVLKVIYLYRSDDDELPLPLSRPYALGLGILTLGIILIGTLFAPWFDWATAAAAAIF